MACPVSTDWVFGIFLESDLLAVHSNIFPKPLWSLSYPSESPSVLLFLRSKCNSIIHKINSDKPVKGGNLKNLMYRKKLIAKLVHAFTKLQILGYENVVLTREFFFR